MRIGMIGVLRLGGVICVGSGAGAEGWVAGMVVGGKEGDGRGEWEAGDTIDVSKANEAELHAVFKALVGEAGADVGLAETDVLWTLD